MNVTVNLKLSNTKSGEYSYSVTSEQYLQVKIGSFVVVNVNNQLKMGTVVKKTLENKNEYQLKPLLAIYSSEPLNKYQASLARAIYENSLAGMLEVQKLFATTITDRKININYYDNDIFIGDFKSASNKKQLVANQELTSSVVIDVQEEVKTYKYVSLNHDISYGKVTSKQQIVVDYLTAVTSQSISKLIAETGISRAVINTMIKNGILNLTEKSKQFETLYELQWHKVNQLSSEQQYAVSCFTTGLNLLYGVSSSGKTEIYIELIKQQIAKGLQVLIIVPSVMLAVQVVGRMQRLFGSDVLIYHNKLTEGERLSYKQQVSQAQKKVIISTFEGICLPYVNLGLVIFDEAHNKHYRFGRGINVSKQVLIDELVSNDIDVLLGSATPSIVDYALTEYGKANLISLPHRYGANNFPDISFVSTQENIITTDLEQLIRINQTREKPTMIFFNKSGYARQVMCSDCYHLHLCPNCQKPLSYSQKNNKLSCKYDGYSSHFSNCCDKCKGNNLKLIGIGIEQYNEQLQEKFPGLIIKIVDSSLDSDQLYTVMRQFGTGEIDILLGTQTIAFGIDFLNVDTVYIANVDNLLTMNESNSHEQAYNLLEQVAGRVGRNSKFSRAIIETDFSHHFVMQAIEKHDYYKYYKQEMELRRAAQVQPFYRICKIEFLAINYQKLINVANEFILRLEASGLSCSALLTPYIAVRYQKSRKYIIIKYRYQNIREIIKANIDILAINNIDYNIDLNNTEIGV